MKEENKVPFYKDLYYKLENEIGVIDTISGLAIGVGVGVVSCVLYWRYTYKYH